MTRLNKLTALAAAVALSGGLAACGGGGGGSTDTSMMPTPEEMCDAAGGRYNADGSCSSAAEVQIEELQAQIAALRTQLGLAPSDDIGASIEDLQTELADLRTQVEDAQDAEDKAAMEAAVATAAKLHAGISAQMGDGDLTNLQANDRDAAYNAAETAILVSIGGDTAAAAAITLSADDDTMVADNHGWTGTRYADPAGGAEYEAIVYSNIEAPTMGRKFGSPEPGTGAGRGYEYMLVNGALNADNADGVGGTGTTFVPTRVAFTGVTRTAGTEFFYLPSDNPSMATTINIPGSYHGVSGTYNCTPGTPADGCSAAVDTDGGFEFASGDTWTFVPSSAAARVTDSEDGDYASYGWWLHKTAFETAFNASAFVDEVGDVSAATGLDDLSGTATYVGGAAGKYALSSTTGGTNDAGHFTARATLEADFNGTATTEDAITGTLDMFYGADGMSRDWEVELMGSTISDAGVIGAASDGTAWTIGDAAADASGSWSGALMNNGDDNVPQVATGTFYTEYGTAGRMVGGFGANLQ